MLEGGNAPPRIKSDAPRFARRAERGLLYRKRYKSTGVIENWSVWLDMQILLMTVFAGKFINDETGAAD